MTASPEIFTASNANFEIIKNDRTARKLAEAALNTDFMLRQEWLSNTFPATFGARRNDTDYYGFEGPSLLWAINSDGARDYVRLWAAETMARGMAHLSHESLTQVAAGNNFDGTDFGIGVSYISLNKREQEGQIAYVATSHGPDWIRPRAENSTLDPSEHDVYGIISRLPALLNDDATREFIQERSNRRNEDPKFPVDFSANGLGGAIIEMDDLVLQVSKLDPNALRTFKAPGVAKGFDKKNSTKTVPVMKDAHLVRAWRTK